MEFAHIEETKKKKKAIFLWPLVHGGVGFSWPATIPSRSCCDGLTSDLLLPRGAAETQLLIQAGFVQLWDIPSVKCHLFYIYSTEVTKWRTIFLLAPHDRVYTVHAGKSENKKANEISSFFFFLIKQNSFTRTSYLHNKTTLYHSTACMGQHQMFSLLRDPWHSSSVLHYTPCVCTG